MPPRPCSLPSYIHAAQQKTSLTRKLYLLSISVVGHVHHTVSLLGRTESLPFYPFLESNFLHREHSGAARRALRKKTPSVAGRDNFLIGQCGKRLKLVNIISFFLIIQERENYTAMILVPMKCQDSWALVPRFFVF